MAKPLKEATAVTVKVGPFLDTDGAVVTGLTISQADIRLSKNGGNIAQSNNATGGTHDELGVYDIPLDTTDTDTPGTLDLYISESGAIIVHHEYTVVPANIYDSMFSSDKLQVDVVQWLGTAVATPSVAGVPEVDLTHVAGATTNVADLATNVDAILTDTSTTLQAELDGIQADTEDIQSRLPAALNNGCIPADVQRINDAEITGDGSGTPFNVA